MCNLRKVTKDKHSPVIFYLYLMINLVLANKYLRHQQLLIQRRRILHRIYHYLQMTVTHSHRLLQTIQLDLLMCTHLSTRHERALRESVSLGEYYLLTL